MTKKVRLILLPACLLLVFAQAAAQNEKTEFPPTPLGNIVKQWIETLNGGAEADLKIFAETQFSAQALREQSAEQRYAVFRKLKEQSGGLEVVSVTPATGVFPMSVIAKSKRGNNFVRLTAGMAGEKLGGLGIDKTVDPHEKQLVELYPQRLSERKLIKTIENRVARLAAENRFSGVVLIARGDRVLFHKSYGFADRDRKIANDAETKFHLASVGKMYTAVAIARLVREGKLSFDDTIGKLLPDFPNREVFGKITVHQLLTHSAGTGTFFESPGFQRKSYPNSTSEIEVYKDEKLFFEPGARWRYSNAGYSLLGAVIERVTGRTYFEYVRESIFAPLGIDDRRADRKKLSILYTQAADDPLGIEPYRPVEGVSDTVGTGFGGGYGSARELFKFARAYRTGKLVGPEMTNLLVTPKIASLPAGKPNWGYGVVQREINGRIVRGHSGGGRTDLQMIWNEGYTVIVQTNVGPPPVTLLSNEILQFLTKQIALRKEK